MENHQLLLQHYMVTGVLPDYMTRTVELRKRKREMTAEIQVILDKKKQRRQARQNTAKTNNTHLEEKKEE